MNEVNVVELVFVVVLVILAVALGTVGILGISGRLPGNRFIGVRTPETRSDRQAWIAAHRAAGPAFCGSAVALALGALGCALVGGLVGWIVAGVSVVMALIVLNIAGLAGARAAAHWQVQPDDSAADGCCGGTTTADQRDIDERDADRPRDTAQTSDPAQDCGVASGCGTCSLNGMCEPQHSVTGNPSAVDQSTAS